MKDPEDPAYGVKAFSIAGRMIYERERIKGMTDAERQWRAQWLKDQELSPDEPRNVPEFYKATNNIFRRLYKDPLYSFQKLLEPSLGPKIAFSARQTLGKSLIFLYASWFTYYLYKYNWNNWTKGKTITVHVTRPAMFPDDPNYPNYRKIEDYYDLGFRSSVFGQSETK